MTQSALADYTQPPSPRFRLTDALVIHRHGRLAVGEPIMMVATAAPHRADAFAAAEYLMGTGSNPAPPSGRRRSGRTVPHGWRPRTTTSCPWPVGINSPARSRPCAGQTPPPAPPNRAG